MNDHAQVALRKAVSILSTGGIIAYPTEAVYGLGCLPTSENSIEKLLNLKQRPKAKGLILVAETIEQLLPYIYISNDVKIEEIKCSWPGHIKICFRKCTPRRKRQSCLGKRKKLTF